MKPEFSFSSSSIEENRALFMDYCSTLATPMDSFVEDYMLKARFFVIGTELQSIGFFALGDKDVLAFYLLPQWTRYGEQLFSRVIDEYSIGEVYFQTSDFYLVSLVTDWEFDKTKSAYFFQDAVEIPMPVLEYHDLSFSAVTNDDVEEIQAKTDNFFDPGDLTNGQIFALRSGTELLGCGIVVRGRFFTACASIGMVTCKEYRRRGVGRYILWSLKQWCYERKLQPIAGCWYYNTLSRHSLESVGLASRSRGMRAVLKGKEDIPARTGNPPGELV